MICSNREKEESQNFHPQISIISEVDAIASGSTENPKCWLPGVLGTVI